MDLASPLTRALLALSLGAIAGLVDVAPMVLRGTPLRVAIVPFVHWTITGLFIQAVSWPLHPALQGALVALLAATPTLVRYGFEQPATVPAVLGMSIMLGALLGVAIAKLM